MEYLYEKLASYGKQDYYGFHMPGHKRNCNVIRAELPYGIDITEIDGFDNLHHAEEIIKEAELRAASLYHWKYGGDFECCYRLHEKGRNDFNGKKLPQICVSRSIFK